MLQIAEGAQLTVRVLKVRLHMFQLETAASVPRFLPPELKTRPSELWVERQLVSSETRWKLVALKVLRVDAVGFQQMLSELCGALVPVRSTFSSGATSR